MFVTSVHDYKGCECKLLHVICVDLQLFLQCHSQMSESVIAAVQATILPADEMAQSPLQQSLSTVVGTDGNTLVHQVQKIFNPSS